VICKVELTKQKDAKYKLTGKEKKHILQAIEDERSDNEEEEKEVIVDLVKA
jgi:hypothetical protein